PLPNHHSSPQPHLSRTLASDPHPLPSLNPEKGPNQRSYVALITPPCDPSSSLTQPMA
ncbi:hypothetical protein GQ607_008452, partial [Colletotrichum asianum]